MAKGIEVASYDPKKVNVIVGGRTITGFAADGVVSVTKNEDSITPAVGAKGDVTYSENANESGTIAITLMSTSSSLSYLRELEAKRRAVNVTISDVNDADAFTLSADNCRVMKMPDLTRNKEQSTITVNGEEYTLQSVSPTWYFGVNDDCGMTGGGRRDTTKYIDTMLKNVVISPAEVKADGISYFDEKDDIKTPEKLIKAIETFLRE